MKKMADNPLTRKWWDFSKPCHEPLKTCADGEWWADMDEVFQCK